MKKLFVLSTSLALCATFVSAQSTCTSTTASVTGAYTYIASEFPFGSSVVVPPGSTSTSQTYSNTSVGSLIQSINGGGAFSSANVLYFDGAGHITAAAATSSFAGTTTVGTYTVNTDCTISVSLTDAFYTPTSTNGVSSSQGAASLIGIVAGGGAEIYLSEAQSASSVNGNQPLEVGQFASRFTIQMVRTYAYGCTVASLQGSYALIGNGFVDLATSSTSTGTSTGSSGSTGTGSTGTSGSGSTGTGSSGSGSSGSGSSGSGSSGSGSGSGSGGGTIVRGFLSGTGSGASGSGSSGSGSSGSGSGTGTSGTGTTGTGTTGTGTTGTGTTGTGTTGTGTTSSTSYTVQPVTLLAVLTFDGAGHVVQQTVPSGSPLGNFQYTGSYTVNLNCSGTMTLSTVSTSGTTSTGTTTTGTGTTTGTTTTGTTTTGTSTSSSASMVNFVLTPPMTYPQTNAYSASPSGNASRPGIEFSFMSSTEALFGWGIAQ